MLWLSAIVVLPFVVDLVVNRRVWGPRWPELLSGPSTCQLHHFYLRDPDRRKKERVAEEKSVELAGSGDSP